MKTILRKAAIAMVAMLAGGSAIAQSFELKTKLNDDIEDLFEYYIHPKFSKDGCTYPIIVDMVRENKYEEYEQSKYTLNSITILNNNFETEKVITSGPLFEEFTEYVVVSEVKSLKLESVTPYYQDQDSTTAINEFYSDFKVRIDKDGEYYYYDYSEAVNEFPADELKLYLEEWISRRYIEENGWLTSTYNGYKLFYKDYHTIELANGTIYPQAGYLYKEYNDIEYLYFHYTPDETEEIERYNTNVSPIFNKEEPWCLDFVNYSEYYVGITQALFNDDEKYEFLIPELALFTEDRGYNSYNQTQTTYYDYKPVGYKVVSEDGTVLSRITVEGAEEDGCWGYVLCLDNKKYFVIETDTYDEENEEYSYYSHFFEIKKSANSTNIEKVRDIKGCMRVRPTVADRNEEISITLDDDNNTARELIITSVNGKIVERRNIPAGENTVKVNAAMMRSGMYNFTLQKKGEIVDNSKVIVK